MPYISQDGRMELNPVINELDNVTIWGAGELNYLVSMVCHHYLKTKRSNNERIHYEDYNTVVGVLESAKLELYARLVRPFEDSKIAQNGDLD